MRRSKEVIEKIKLKFGVDDIYSWSKFNCYNNDRYEFYLKYILHIPPDRNDSIYSNGGNEAHNILERLYNKEIKYEDMTNLYEDVIFELQLKGLKFDRCCETKNKKIADKYFKCLRHFFKYHKPIPFIVTSESYMLVMIDKFLFQGYIDAIHKEDEKFIITDWKTSSIYTGEKFEKEISQLILYAVALINKGVNVQDIKLRWNFLKYVNVTVEQANGESKVRQILRSEIGSCLASNLKMWLKKSKLYTEEEIEDYCNQLVESNDLSCLPKGIQLKYNVDDCYVYVDVDNKVIKEFKIYIYEKLVEITKKIKEYEKTQDENIFWQEVTKSSSYFLANLSGFSARIHKPYSEYLDNRNGYKNSIVNDDWMKDLF